MLVFPSIRAKRLFPQKSEKLLFLGVPTRFIQKAPLRRFGLAIVLTVRECTGRSSCPGNQFLNLLVTSSFRVVLQVYDSAKLRETGSNAAWA